MTDKPYSKRELDGKFKVFLDKFLEFEKDMRESNSRIETAVGITNGRVKELELARARGEGFSKAMAIFGAAAWTVGGGGGNSSGFGAGTGGSGGGANGGVDANAGGNATANTGGGGGGGGFNVGNGGNGGSGVVIIAFLEDGSTGVSTSSTGGTITSSGGYQIHTFNSSGTFTCVLVAAGPTNVKTWDGVTQSTGVKTYIGNALASTKSVNGVT